MYFTTMLLFLSFVSTCHEVESNGVSDDCEKCKIGLVADVEKNIDNLTEKKLLGFLSTFDESCVDNVEFSEYSNTVLFLSLLRQPELIIRLLDTHDEISLKQIKKELRNPVNDSINLGEVYKTIETVAGYEKVKISLLESIEIAMEKYD